jgi:rhodanese-related sulfurtransferase
MFGFQEVDAPVLAEVLSSEAQNVALIDVRTPAEVARGVIPGARHVPLHLIPLMADELAGAGRLVFYCQSGARSGQACAFMMSRGHGNVANLRGGILGWLQHGKPLATEQGAA